MSFGQALHEVMERHGDTQMELSAVAHVSNSTISKYVRGTRRPPEDVMRSVATHYDEAELYIAAANEATGEAWVPWMNNADLHRATTHLKTLEEIEEAVQAMRSAPITKRGDQITQQERELVRRAIMECIEAITALTHHVAILCKEYTFSWFGLWKEHRQKLRAHKYLK
ncbi:Xre family transcriptional regulator [Paenibacillus sp. 32O-W]|uniref:helix-turn-helix domain-containing protein n=1 Tax=Paenibacillus sp. 32O-W TaxID=1695218 RepID=UPI00071FBCEE|nr:helix-turn-helix transcriptional regulator [Paenibacillus sp. 32O-W]ALS27158.1 Xre family transcriptional regulator [Paenibacillus sp. 32O-W]